MSDPGVRPRRGERGFTLVEVVVAAALAFLALAVAASALVSAGRLFALAPRALRGGERELAERLLRGDLAAGVPLAGGGLPGDPLPLERDGRRVVWELDGERLLRRVEEPGRPAEPGRLILDEVLYFQWRVVGPRAVAVQLVRRTAPRLDASHLTTPGWHRASGSSGGLESLELLVAMRRHG